MNGKNTKYPTKSWLNNYIYQQTMGQSEDSNVSVMGFVV